MAAYRLMRDPDVRAAIDAAWRAQLEQWKRERRESEQERGLIRAREMAGERGRLFR